ncbi:MAG: serine/threonine-protein kinase [Planctomycetota bacterium]
MTNDVRTNGCLDEGALSRIAEGADAGSDDGAHLEHCDGCRRRLDDARRDQQLFEELRHTAEAPAPPLGADDVPGYRLQEVLHRGGQGIVYRAIQRSTRRSVAVKVLATSGYASYRARLRFEREVDLACRLRHPGIVVVHDRGVAGERPFFAMELVEGRVLGAWLAAERPDRERRLRLFAELCDALTYAHRRGVIHRDLKPSNVLVDEGGRPRVLDFGVAHALDSSRGRVTVAGEFTGTLTYASPEQVAGDPAAVDTRTDVYSLGVVLYEMLTGELPYDTRGPLQEVVARIREAPPRAPHELGLRLSADLWTIVATALAKDAAERYASVDALARDVEHFLANEPIEARSRGAWYELRKGLARHRLALLAASVVLLLGTALAAGAVRERLRAERQRETARLVGEVFQDLLGAAAPQRMGGDVRLLEMFEEASSRIEEGLGDAPDVQAAVQLTIGDTYRRLLMFHEAEPHLRKAVERYRRFDRGERLDLAQALYVLGRALTGLNHPDAVAVHEESLSLRTAALPPDDARIARSERELAAALSAQWKSSAEEHERALQLLRRARERFGDDALEAAEADLLLARLSYAELRSDIEPLLRDALAVFDRDAPKDPRTIECLSSYSSFLQEEGRLDEAERLLERSVALTRTLYGEERAAAMLARQARLRHERGDPATAEELSARALAHELASWAAKEPAAASELHALAARVVAPASGATPPYAEAFRRLRAFRGDGAFELAGWSNDLAQSLVAQDRVGEAETVLREALHVRCRAYGADCPIRAGTLARLGELLVDAGRTDEARPLLEEVAATAARLGHEEARSAVLARELLARCCGGGE